MKLIDKTELIAKMLPYGMNNNSKNQTIDTLIEMVVSAPVIESDKWVSVKDKLPEEDQTVLAYTPCDGVVFVGYCHKYKYENSISWLIYTARGSIKIITKKYLIGCYCQNCQKI